jgi:5-methylcytosine-specific restriction endonuclease McrA
LSDLPNAPRRRTVPPHEIRVRVFRRDGWICHLCGLPVLFPPALKYLQRHSRKLGYNGPLALFDDFWTRTHAPLLHHLGAVVDHVEAFARGGAHDESNFATACTKCNNRKLSVPMVEFAARSPRRPVTSRHGEPRDWDGLSGLFLCLLERDRSSATQDEKKWYDALLSDMSDARASGDPSEQ